MRSTTQDEITIKLSMNDEAPPNWRDTPDKFITLRAHAADAFRKLLAAGRHGVHKSEYKPDALARFEQAGVPYELFDSIRRGSTRRDWCRLKLPACYNVSIVGEAA